MCVTNKLFYVYGQQEGDTVNSTTKVYSFIVWGSIVKVVFLSFKYLWISTQELCESLIHK